VVSPVVAGFRLAAALVPLLPEAAVEGTAAVVGAASYALGAGARRGIVGNLARVLDPGDPDLIALRAREAFRTQAHNYLDLFRIPAQPLDLINARIDLNGWEHVEAALARGRGAIFAAAHLGNIDLVAQAAIARGAPVTIPIETIEPPELLELVTRLRTAHGLRLLPLAPGKGLRVYGELTRELRAGAIVGFAIDRDVQGSGEPSRFFGGRARLSPAPAVLSLRTGAPILVVRTRRLPGGRFRGDIERAIVPSPDRTAPEAVAALMAQVVRPLEGAIRQTPGQWVMFQPLFEDE
jgi:KDO2-lipid IV(A) lauroyltransferase